MTDLELKVPRQVRGRVDVEGGGAAPSFGLRLAGGPAGEETLVIAPQRDGSFTVFLPVGEHRAAPALGLRGYTVQSARYGTTDVLKGSISIPATAPADTFVIQLKPAP